MNSGLPVQDILVYASLEDEAMIAVAQAAELARANGARLTVVRVLGDAGPLERWSRRGRAQGDARAPDDVRAFVEQSQRELLESHVAPLREEGLKVDIDIRWGAPWLELIQMVLRNGHDLVVKTAEGAARGRGLWFGSTALHLIRKCPCPVWVVSSDGAAHPRRVLAAVDPTSEETRAAVGRRVLNLANSLADEQTEVHAVAVWRAASESLLRRRVSPEELEDYVSSIHREAREALDGILEQSAEPLPDDRVHLLRGDERRVLPEFVEARYFDLVVMGSLGRGGIAGLLIGEAAETLIRSVRCSVLVVKPPDFVCPVELPAEAG